MRHPLLDFSARGWGRVILWTVLGTAVCVAVALYVDSFNFPGMSEEEFTRAILVNVLLPIVLAVPMLLFLTIKLRELAIAHDQLARYAATDSLTSVLNRGAFTSLVEGYLSEVRAEERRGALLVVDADNFKKINDRFGHDSGDVALKAIADTIKTMLRGADIVGRIGGEEFGVFLPGSGLDQAEAVAERIRGGVVDTAFAPDGTPVTLTVSVGGAVFDRRLAFGELFRLADQQLYAAKKRGRNRVCVAPVDGQGIFPMVAA
jgi:diguanylate cyclase (GGDEF)-like protein